MARALLSDTQWTRIEAVLPGKVSDSGVTAADNRRFIEAVLWIARTGSPWAASPYWPPCMRAPLTSPHLPPCALHCRRPTRRFQSVLRWELRSLSTSLLEFRSTTGSPTTFINSESELMLRASGGARNFDNCLRQIKAAQQSCCQTTFVVSQDALVTHWSATLAGHHQPISAPDRKSNHQLKLHAR